MKAILLKISLLMFANIDAKIVHLSDSITRKDAISLPLSSDIKPVKEKCNDDLRREDYSQNLFGDNYAFGYAVNDEHSGEDFSHSEARKGDFTKGEYRVKLPDGRMQVVQYVADSAGYRPHVRYSKAHIKGSFKSSFPSSQTPTSVSTPGVAVFSYREYGEQPRKNLKDIESSTKLFSHHGDRTTPSSFRNDAKTPSFTFNNDIKSPLTFSYSDKTTPSSYHSDRSTLSSYHSNMREPSSFYNSDKTTSPPFHGDIKAPSSFYYSDKTTPSSYLSDRKTPSLYGDRTTLSSLYNNDKIAQSPFNNDVVTQYYDDRTTPMPYDGYREKPLSYNDVGSLQSEKIKDYTRGDSSNVASATPNTPVYAIHSYQPFMRSRNPKYETFEPSSEVSPKINISTLIPMTDLSGVPPNLIAQINLLLAFINSNTQNTTHPNQRKFKELNQIYTRQDPFMDTAESNYPFPKGTQNYSEFYKNYNLTLPSNLIDSLSTLEKIKNNERGSSLLTDPKILSNMLAFQNKLDSSGGAKNQNLESIKTEDLEKIMSSILPDSEKVIEIRQLNSKQFHNRNNHQLLPRATLPSLSKEKVEIFLNSQPNHVTKRIIVPTTTTPITVPRYTTSKILPTRTDFQRKQQSGVEVDVVKSVSSAYPPEIIDYYAVEYPTVIDVPSVTPDANSNKDDSVYYRENPNSNNEEAIFNNEGVNFKSQEVPNYRDYEDIIVKDPTPTKPTIPDEKPTPGPEEDLIDLPLKVVSSTSFPLEKTKQYIENDNVLTRLLYSNFPDEALKGIKVPPPVNQNFNFQVAESEFVPSYALPTDNRNQISKNENGFHNRRSDVEQPGTHLNKNLVSERKRGLYNQRSNIDQTPHKSRENPTKEQIPDIKNKVRHSDQSPLSYIKNPSDFYNENYLNPNSLSPHHPIKLHAFDSRRSIYNNFQESSKSKLETSEKIRNATRIIRSIRSLGIDEAKKVTKSDEFDSIYGQRSPNKRQDSDRKIIFGNGNSSSEYSSPALNEISKQSQSSYSLNTNKNLDYSEFDNPNRIIRKSQLLNHIPKSEEYKKNDNLNKKGYSGQNTSNNIPIKLKTSNTPTVTENSNLIEIIEPNRQKAHNIQAINHDEGLKGPGLYYENTTTPLNQIPFAQNDTLMEPQNARTNFIQPLDSVENFSGPGEIGRRNNISILNLPVGKTKRICEGNDFCDNSNFANSSNFIYLIPSNKSPNKRQTSTIPKSSRPSFDLKFQESQVAGAGLTIPIYIDVTPKLNFNYPPSTPFISDKTLNNAQTRPTVQKWPAESSDFEVYEPHQMAESTGSIPIYIQLVSDFSKKDPFALDKTSYKDPISASPKATTYRSNFKLEESQPETRFIPVYAALSPEQHLNYSDSIPIISSQLNKDKTHVVPKFTSRSFDLKHRESQKTSQSRSIPIYQGLKREQTFENSLSFASKNLNKVKTPVVPKSTAGRSGFKLQEYQQASESRVVPVYIEISPDSNFNYPNLSPYTSNRKPNKKEKIPSLPQSIARNLDLNLHESHQSAETGFLPIYIDLTPEVIIQDLKTEGADTGKSSSEYTDENYLSDAGETSLEYEYETPLKYTEETRSINTDETPWMPISGENLVTTTVRPKMKSNIADTVHLTVGPDISKIHLTTPLPLKKFPQEKFLLEIRKKVVPEASPVVKRVHTFVRANRN